MVLPRKVELDGDVSNLDLCGDRINYGEPTESISDPEESKLRLFFDDSLDKKPNPFLFWKLP